MVAIGPIVQSSFVRVPIIGINEDWFAKTPNHV